LDALDTLYASLVVTMKVISTGLSVFTVDPCPLPKLLEALLDVILSSSWTAQPSGLVTVLVSQRLEVLTGCPFYD
jgi:hypothetical protein